jgi:hypothetical protein
MTNRMKQAAPLWPSWAGGLGIGLVLIVAVALVQPIGVSTQYVVLDGVALHRVLPNVANRSPYLTEAAQGWTLVFAFVFPHLKTFLVALDQYAPVTLQGWLGVPGPVVAVPFSLLCLWAARKLPETRGSR